MSFFDILLLSVALAMDCFTVSIVSGTIISPPRGTVVVRLSILFGLFQALMPLLGWLGTTWLAEYIEAYDHWVAFGMLAFLGGRMIRDAFRPEEEHHFDPKNWWTGIVLAVATSIDALAVGISLAMTGYQTLSSLLLPLVAIGIGSFLFSVLGHLLGIRFGAGIRRRLRPELLGGIILIGIGVKILLTHMV
ncbi:MAG: manganese efflux pump, partial [Prevotella sp.]|nr:manganese efflux pump [Prevotella sp.]